MNPTTPLQKELARLEVWREKKKVEITSSPAHSSPQPSSSPPLSKTISWTNHRPPSMTDIPQLDGDISLVDPGTQFGAVRGTLNIEPDPF